MKIIEIYLAGGMSKFGKEEFERGNAWRIACKDTLERRYYKHKANITNPNDYFNFLEKTYQSQREIMDFDLNRVRNSNLIIVNFNDPASMGTMAEIAVAYDRQIPVLGLNENGYRLHSWQCEMCNRVFDSLDLLLRYVELNYLN